MDSTELETVFSAHKTASENRIATGRLLPAGLRSSHAPNRLGRNVLRRDLPGKRENAGFCPAFSPTRVKRELAPVFSAPRNGGYRAHVERLSPRDDFGRFWQTERGFSSVCPAAIPGVLPQRKALLPTPKGLLPLSLRPDQVDGQVTPLTQPGLS
jgi:hypothetical protein